MTPGTEVYLRLSALRDDVVLTGFELTEVTHTAPGDRVIIGCEAGGNGAPSGFQVTDGVDQIAVTPTGPGSQTGKTVSISDPRQ